ncbi:hypothetical protein HMI54_001242 [Coelomomyces lativittatus]|nr:hypothetical protein HMI55_001026 [Coelomomyces lativittatus]KAJ1507663.1 hypothetical protein HMI56_007677 [Coelomomyces lativittatus]KAJ1510948.1 hypothetical protein HMI54_001242 [Coelomomyces lativittatus]
MANRFSLSFLIIAFYLLLLNGNGILGTPQSGGKNGQRPHSTDAKPHTNGQWYLMYVGETGLQQPPPRLLESDSPNNKEMKSSSKIDSPNNKEVIPPSIPNQRKSEGNLRQNNQRRPTNQNQHQPLSTERTRVAPVNPAEYANLVKEIFGTSSIMQVKYPNFDSISSISIFGVLTALYDLVKPESKSYSELQEYFPLERHKYSLDSLRELKKNLLKNDFHFENIFYRGTNTRGDPAGLKSQLEKSDTVVVNSISEFINYGGKIKGKSFRELTKTHNENTQTLGSFITYRYTWGNLKVLPVRRVFRVYSEYNDGVEYANFLELTGKVKVLRTDTETVVKIPLQKVDAGQQVESNGEVSLLLIRKNDVILDLEYFKSLSTAMSGVQEEQKTILFPRFSFHETMIINENTLKTLLKSGNQDLPLLGTFKEGKISTSSGGCVRVSGVNGFGFTKFEVGQEVDDRNEEQSKYEMDKSDINIRGLNFDQGFYFVLIAESANAPLAVTYVKPSSVNQFLEDCAE